MSSLPSSWAWGGSRRCPLDKLETSAVPPNVVLVSDFAIEIAFRTSLGNAQIQLCGNDEEFDTAYEAATHKHFACKEAKERFHCPRGVTSVEIMREARDLGFISAERFNEISRAYDTVTEAMRAPTAQDQAAFPLMPQRAADTAAAWAAFGRYVRHRLGCPQMQFARRLMLRDGGVRVAYHALRTLQLDTTKAPQQSTAATRGTMMQRAFHYVNDVGNILSGGFPIKDTEHDVKSVHAIEEDDWSSEEEVNEQGTEGSDPSSSDEFDDSETDCSEDDEDDDY